MSPLAESKLQLIDLLGLAQLANQRGYGNKNTNTTSIASGGIDQAMKAEQLRQAKLNNLLLQNEYEQQTSEPTITMPGVMASGGSTGGAYKVPITALPGQVSGQRASMYGQQAHEGFMQTGRLMTDMAQTAATAAAHAAPYANQPTWQQRVDEAQNAKRQSRNMAGTYPIEASGIKNLLAEASNTKAEAAASLAQRDQWDKEYGAMERQNIEENKPYFEKANAAINKANQVIKTEIKQPAKETAADKMNRLIIDRTARGELTPEKYTQYTTQAVGKTAAEREALLNSMLGK